ncbi:DNA-binding transcriptional ArsR family regulator [Microbacteriaceae bacterium SG_E_30_P1]|uniref:DNA-binding transcriptional ArsR family regulator n=1 Tax=Antiquaquibacter oligotrophicus TaxID=2880260 RepID=A0ABT6KJU6_9MICO|nr:metalloregulator ArsR/SmtB family transcription factor [Antiquaquibacter oligotrophicus]MDH6180273.1 DNA-binding transcriptional ArsR family regulator [Antiquaquibacter oligotrophicus]UDF13980.1 metalloregulator ArsR/SmtB family transcription factor [Antiquaquibacter oligotrophicus]
MITVATRLDAMHRLGRAMADPTRSRILLRLLDAPAYPAALAEELGLTRQNVSNHLACLRDCGIVVVEPEGRQSRYEISDPLIAHALSDLVQVILQVDENAPSHEPNAECC